MSPRPPFCRVVPAFAALMLVSGCGSFDAVSNLIPHHDVNDENLNLGANPRQVSGIPAQRPGEKPTVLPVAAQDINCPTVDIPEGGAALRVGGPENASVRYQFNISDTARQCDPTGPGEASIKIGVAGNLVIGAAGTGGTFSAPLRVSIIQDSDKKTIFSKVYTLNVTSSENSPGQFRIVMDPIVLPMPTLQLADLYSVNVGFGSGASEAKAKPRRRRGG